MFMAFRAVHTHLANTHQHVDAIQFIEQAKYDEMSLRVRLSEGKDYSPDAGFTGSELKEPALSKLLQIQVAYSALRDIKTADGGCQHIMAVVKGPTTIRAIEKNNAESLKEGLVRQSQVPPWFRDEFRYHTRLITADDHPANNKADLSIAAGRSHYQQLLKYLCYVHKNIELLIFNGESFRWRNLACYIRP